MSLEGTSLQALGAQNEELHQDYMVRNKNRHYLLKKEKVFVRMRVACELREKLPKQGTQPFTGCVCCSCLFCFYTTAISAQAERGLSVGDLLPFYLLTLYSIWDPAREMLTFTLRVDLLSLHLAGNTFTHKPCHVS